MGNKFLIDLSSLTLNEDQVKSIDLALQQAVSAELLKLQTKGKITLIPLPASKDGISYGATFGYRAE